MCVCVYSHTQCICCVCRSEGVANPVTRALSLCHTLPVSPLPLVFPSLFLSLASTSCRPVSLSWKAVRGLTQAATGPGLLLLAPAALPLILLHHTSHHSSKYMEMYQSEWKNVKRGPCCRATGSEVRIGKALLLEEGDSRGEACVSVGERLEDNLFALLGEMGRGSSGESDVHPLRQDSTAVMLKPITLTYLILAPSKLQTMSNY